MEITNEHESIIRAQNENQLNDKHSNYSTAYETERNLSTPNYNLK
jgi:hypothetical protein